MDGFSRVGGRAERCRRGRAVPTTSLDGDHATAQSPRLRPHLLGPKSVSVLWGVADRTISPIVRDAHDRAVEEAVGYIERHATWTRRGRGGHRVLRGSGLCVAAFRHRSSRAGDPQLHTHAVVANATLAEGRATTLDGRALYAHARTAGYLYEAALRKNLTEALGVEWESAQKGIAEIRGVDPDVLAHFSQRRTEILEQLNRVGGRSRRAAEIAALDTRRAKNYDIDGPSLRDRWRDRAAELRFDQRTIDALLDRSHPRPARQPDLRATAAQLAGPEGVTQQSSTFDRRDVLQMWAEAYRDGVDIERLEEVTDHWLASASAVQLEDNAGRQHLGGPRYSTPELLVLEQRLIADAVDRQRDDVARVDPAVATATLDGRPRLSGEQAAMAARLTTSGAGIEVVRAAAGTGKTQALAAAREVWEDAGIRVYGCALAARAAVEMETIAGIDSTTIAALERDIDQGHGLPEGSVLVVDEAGMVGSRTIDNLAGHAAETKSKLVLVGDDRQLPEIDAGGAFRGLAENLGAIELHEIRRQGAAWDRDALSELRDGDVTAWVDAYRDHGRLVARSTADELRQTLVGDWWEAARTGDCDAVMIAHRRCDVADLNALARMRMHRDGKLGADDVVAGDRAFAAGDRVVARRNDRRVGVVNGTRAEVIAVDPERRTVSIRSDRGDERTLTSAYLDEGWLDHGYALTAHTAQGATVDRSFVLGSDELYREWGYTAMSRHRDQAQFYVVSPGSVERTLPGLEPDNDDLAHAAAATFALSRTKDMAVDLLAQQPPLVGFRATDQARMGLPSPPSVTRESLLLPSPALISSVGRRPDAFLARERWLRDAVRVLEGARPQPPAPADQLIDAGLEL
ncbi:MAG TPA: MobF family relaxase [Baekduia sp.]